MNKQLIFLSILCMIHHLSLQTMERKKTHDEFMKQQQDSTPASSLELAAQQNAVLAGAGPAVHVAAAGPAAPVAALAAQQAALIAQEIAPDQQRLPVQVEAASPTVALPLSVGDVSNKEKEEKIKESDASKTLAEKQKQTAIDFENIVIVIDDKEEKFDATTVDAFSMSEFKDLIQNKFAARDPYIIVQVTTHTGGKTFVHYFDAHQFNLYYFNKRTHTYPLLDGDDNRELKQTYVDNTRKAYVNISNKLPLTSKEIVYFINSLESPTQFTRLCSHTDLYLSDQDTRQFWHATMSGNQNQNAQDRAEAQYSLGLWHINKSTELNLKKAFALFSAIDLAKLAPKDKTFVQYKLGMALEGGEPMGQKPNYEKAFNALSVIDFEQLDPHRRAFAQFKLGCCYEAGRGTPQNYNKAFELFSAVDLTKLIPSNKSFTQYLLGRCYLLGRGTAQNHQKAFDLITASDLVEFLPDIMPYINTLMISFESLSRQDKVKLGELLSEIYRDNKINDPLLFNKTFITLQKFRELDYPSKQEFAQLQYAVGLMHLDSKNLNTNPAKATECFIYALRNGTPNIQDLAQSQLLIAIKPLRLMRAR